MKELFYIGTMMLYSREWRIGNNAWSGTRLPTKLEIMFQEAIEILGFEYVDHSVTEKGEIVRDSGLRIQVSDSPLTPCHILLEWSPFSTDYHGFNMLGNRKSVQNILGVTDYPTVKKFNAFGSSETIYIQIQKKN